MRNSFKTILVPRKHNIGEKNFQYIRTRATIMILGPLGSPVSWAQTKRKGVERRYMQKIIKGDIINQLCHSHANSSTIILAKDFTMLV